MSDVEEQLEEMMNQLATLADIWIGEGKDPHAIAAAMNVVSLKIYRTSLDDESFNTMMDTINETRSKILPYGAMIQ